MWCVVIEVRRLRVLKTMKRSIRRCAVRSLFMITFVVVQLAQPYRTVGAIVASND